MTTVINDIQQALEEQDIEKVYEFYHRFFDHFDPEKDLQEMADLATYSVSIDFSAPYWRRYRWRGGRQVRRRFAALRHKSVCFALGRKTSAWLCRWGRSRRRV